jgi:uncharacterized protein (DUF4415 family)
MSGTSKKLIERSAGSGPFANREQASRPFTGTANGLAERARRAAAAITDEEDAAITAGAMADPDALPNRFIGKRRGRPKASSTKELVTLRLDPDVLRFFKRDGDGWQTRINEALRKTAGLD